MYTNFGAELMATAKEYPVKIRKIPVLDKKTGITYFEIRRTRYDPVRKYEVILSSERTGEKLDPEAGEVVACRPKRGTKRAQRAAGEAAAATSTSTPASTSPATQPEPVPQQTVEPQPTSVTTRVNTGAIDILAMVGIPGWTPPFVLPIRTAESPTRSSRLPGIWLLLAETQFTTLTFGSTTMTCRTSSVCPRMSATTLKAEKYTLTHFPAGK